MKWVLCEWTILLEYIYRVFFAIVQCYASSVKFFDCDNFTVALSRVETVTSDNNSECDNATGNNAQYDGRPVSVSVSHPVIEKLCHEDQGQGWSGFYGLKIDP